MDRREKKARIVLLIPLSIAIESIPTKFAVAESLHPRLLNSSCSSFLRDFEDFMNWFLLRRKKEKFNRRKNRVNGQTWNWKLHFWIQDFFLFIMVLFFLWKSEEMTWFIFYSITPQSCSKNVFYYII